jgi:hypothetical protein
MIRLRGRMPASAVVAEAETTVPGLQPPHASETLQDPDVLPRPSSRTPQTVNRDAAHEPDAEARRTRRRRVTRVPNAFPVAATASAVVAPRPPGLPPRRSPRVIGRALVALTKPRIIELLLVTTVPTMLLAQRGLPSLRLILVTLIGGTLAAGSANTINCYIDRDIDAVMKRTSRRPLVVNGQGTIKPWEALAWGILLGAGATLLLGLMANWLAASLADAAILFYIFVYTLLLKRRSPANIVIGGAAGCFPVLVGWAAVTGTVADARHRAVRGHLLVDPAAFLGAGHEVPQGLRGGQRPDAARGGLARHGRPQDLVVLLRDGGGHPGPDPVRRLDLRRLRRRAGRLVPGRGPPPEHPHPGPLRPEPRRPQAAPRRFAPASPAPMRLFHLSIAYLTLLFAAVAWGPPRRSRGATGRNGPGLGSSFSAARVRSAWPSWPRSISPAPR